MFQARIPGDLPPDALAAKARTLVTADECLTVGVLGRVAASAARVFSGMQSHPALRALLDGAVCHYEVPISVLPATGEPGGRARILRGVIDCLACRPDGRVVVVDFKTGARRPGDRHQLGAYVNAVRSLFPGARVDGLLVYAGAAS
jgi:ATP-dependent exoDNAse (exonuclease V) beta subunit